MPKKGYTGITLKTEIAKLLRQKAKKSGLTINQYLLWLLNQKEAQIKSLLSLWPVGPRGFKSRTPRQTVCLRKLVFWRVFLKKFVFGCLLFLRLSWFFIYLRPRFKHICWDYLSWRPYFNFLVVLFEIFVKCCYFVVVIIFFDSWCQNMFCLFLIRLGIHAVLWIMSFID